jgi:hypothetical protein
MGQTLDELIHRAQEPNRYERVPGLFRRWELEDVIEAGHEYRVEEAGQDDNGSPLFALYRRACRDEEPTS